MDIKRLDERQLRIILAAQLNANTSIEALSRKTGYRQHIVRYVLRDLIAEQLIRSSAVINTYQMGYLHFGIYVNFAFENERARVSFVRKLAREPRVIDLFELGGDYRLGLVIRVSEMEELLDFWRRMEHSKGVQVFQKEITSRLCSSIFQRTYLLNNYNVKPGEKRQHLTFRREGDRLSVDQKDSSILDGLNQLEYNSQRELARKMSLPHSTLERRIRIMEESGIIVGYVYGMVSHRFGIQTYRLLIYTRGLGEQAWKKMHAIAKSEPNVVLLVQCLGSWDFEMLIEVEEGRTVDSVLQSLYRELGNELLSIKTLPLFRFLKSQHRIQLAVS